MKKIICLICARAGSKGLKNKNIKKFYNKPLIEWTFKVAKSIKEFHKVILSTDSKKIIKIAKKNKIEVPFTRPKHLAKDNSKEIYVWRHALKYLQTVDEFPDVLVILPVTSPLRKKEHVKHAIKKFIKDKSDVLISIKESDNNPYFNMIELSKKKNAKIVNNKKRFARRQDAPKVYSMSTICFILRPKFILKNKSIFDGRVTTALFDRKYSVDIDDNYDFELAKYFFYKKK